jgi:tRNA A-37 threonylcarbamoyl transferase component Bud32
MGVATLSEKYRELLQRHGLTTFQAITDLPCVLVGCHPDRSVSRVCLGAGPTAVSGFLKREQRVTWKDRLASWWAGFGLASKSLREARVLCALHAAGVTCPEVIACGEDRRAGAFLLVRELHGYLDLRTFLAEHQAHVRARFAQFLGAILARLHEAGFDQPDLYSKHVLVHPETFRIAIVDWQRSRRRRRVSWRQRCRDLAALDATLGEEFATARERLLCLKTYLAHCTLPPRLTTFARSIRQRSQQLQGKRRLRELRQPALAPTEQLLIPLNQGRLYVAPDLFAQLDARLAQFLDYAGFAPTSRDAVQQLAVTLPDGRAALLTRRRVYRPCGWLWGWLRGRPPQSPERQQADTLFRLQRHGIPAPRLLAYGQRQGPPWCSESLLLVEQLSENVRAASASERCEHGRSRVLTASQVLCEAHV